jgi:hypothetical protein
MDNHLHLLARLAPEDADTWSDEEVLQRWISVYPPKTLRGENTKITQAWIANQAKDKKRVAVIRQRLASLSWFMKALKEPLARLANQEDDCRGAFWEGRFKTIAVLDEEALLATCAYIDLNPVAAGTAKLPETSRHTSIRQRVDHVCQQGKLAQLQAARSGSVAGRHACGDLDQGHWLCPMDDRRQLGAPRAGILEGFSLGSYLLLVDYTARIVREGKARLQSSVAEIFERLGTSAEVWSDRLKLLLRRNRLRGVYFCTDRQRLRHLADRRGHHHLANLAGCPA